jgi:hypothetical protein
MTELTIASLWRLNWRHIMANWLSGSPRTFQS